MFGGSSASWLLMGSVQGPVNLTLIYHCGCFSVGLGLSGHVCFSGYCGEVIVAVSEKSLKILLFFLQFNSICEKQRGRVSVWKGGSV